MVRRLYLLITVGALALAGSNCSSSAEKKKSSPKEETKKTTGTTTKGTTTTGGTTTGSDCTTPAASTTTGGTGTTTDDTKIGGEAGGGTAAEESVTLALAESDYDAVKSIIDDQCVACHTAGGAAPGDYSTYAGAKADAAKIVDRVKSTDKPMPPKGMPALSSSDIAKLEAWITAEAGGSGSSDTPPTTTDAGCGTTTGGETTGGETTGGETDTKDEPPPPDGDFFNEILTPEAKADCAKKGLVYNWGTQACDTAKMPAGFSCDRAGILTFFHNDPSVKTLLDQKDAAKWTYDQCGIDGTTGVVFFLCPTADGTTCMTVAEIKAQKNIPSLQMKFSCIGRTTDPATGAKCAKKP